MYPFFFYQIWWKEEKNLGEEGKIDSSSINENVSMEILLKVCETLSCGIEDIVEFVPDDAKEKHGA